MKELKITDIREHEGDAAFLVDDGETAIMYDSGFGFTGYKVADRIKSILGDRRLDYIFLTHSHYDHALGSAYALKYYPDAKVVAGEHAAMIFNKPSAKAVMRDLDRKFAKTCGVEDYEDLVDEIRVDITVKDGDVIRAGDLEFEVISLPGHTRDSIAFYCRERKLLLSCETLGIYDGEGGVIPFYLVGYQMALDSIDKVMALDIDNILVPHTRLLDKEETRVYLSKAKKAAMDYAEDIVKMFKNGMSDDEVFEHLKGRFYHGYVKSIYPIDAMTLNTTIMIRLVKKELLS